jgi:hypothetical protein
MRPSRLGRTMLAGAAVLLLLGFAHWSVGGAGSFVVFVMAAFIFIYVPGSRLVAWLGLLFETTTLERTMLALALGIPTSSAVYWLCGYFHARPLFCVWPVLCLLAGRLWRGRMDRAQPAATESIPLASLVLVWLVVLLPLAVLPMCFRNLSPTPGGGLAVYATPDATLHLAIANELTHTIPPQNPFIPGHSLNYHYGMHLLAAMLAVPGLGTTDLTLRYVPLLGMSLLVLACFCCGRRWLGGEGAGLLWALLVVLGEDWSFVPGLLLKAPQIWAVHFFGMPTSSSLFMVNPMLSGLALLIAALCCFERYFATDRRGWLVASALLVASLAEYKVFVPALVLAGLALTAFVYAVRFREWSAARCLTATLALTLPLMLIAWSVNGGEIATRLMPWPYVPAAIARMGLVQTSLMRLTADFFMGRWSVAAALAFCGVSLPLYLLLTFGARSAGFGSWLRTLLRPERDRVFAYLVAAMVLIGVPLSLLFTVGPAGYPRGDYASFYNNAVWFLVLSKYLAWPFAVGAVLRWAGGKRGRKMAGGALLLLLAVPSTLQMIAIGGSSTASVLDAPTVSALAALAADARPGAIVWAQEDVAQKVLATTRCRAFAPLLVAPYTYAGLGPGEEAALRSRRKAFWNAWTAAALGDDEGRAAVATLVELHIDYVVASVSLEPGALRSQLPLDPVFADEALAVYRVRR